MGFRFHKAFSLIPGIKLNMSKSGPSISVGGKGFTYNVGAKGTRTTASIPGSGMSYTTRKSMGGGSVNKYVMMALMIAAAYGLQWAKSKGYF